MTFRVDFDDRQPIGFRPWTTLYVINAAAGLQVPLTALVDTGADVTQVPDAAAANLGIDLSAARATTVTTAGGPQTTRRMPVEVRVFGCRFWTDVDFSPNPITLIGRSSLVVPGPLEVMGLSDSELLLKLDTRAHLLNHLRVLQGAGVDDPDVDLFVAVLTRDLKALQSALLRGADPNITDGELLRRHAAGSGE